MRRQYVRIVAAALAMMAGITAFAAYPDKPVRVIVPFPAGGPVDTVTRVVAERISSELKQTVVVENRAGAAGQIGSEAAANSTADGYTLLMGSSSTHSLPTLLGQKLANSIGSMMAGRFSRMCGFKAFLMLGVMSIVARPVAMA
jgi:tripartite-type tricarboxylate transporter receptor subunit TctC